VRSEAQKRWEKNTTKSALSFCNKLTAWTLSVNLACEVTDQCHPSTDLSDWQGGRLNQYSPKDIK
jgi:hypothetical protein